MDYTALKQELADRGFDDISDTRRGQYINRARAWLDDYTLWPYREASVTGSPAPLQVTDLGVVEVVLNMDTQVALQPLTYLRLQALFGDLSVAGDPTYWYLATPAGVPEVATFPTSSTASIGVQYWKVTPDLSAGADTPAAPSRFHQLIVDLAVQFAYRDAENHEAAVALQAQIDRDLGVMVGALLQGQVQTSKYVWTRGVNF